MFCYYFDKIYRSFTKLLTVNYEEKTCFITILDCFVEYYEKLFEISMDTKKNVSRRLTKAKKENKVTSQSRQYQNQFVSFRLADVDFNIE